MKDYGPQFQKETGRRQKVERRNTYGRQEERTWLWRASSVVALIVMVIGVGVSLWFGYRINHGLDELAGRQSRLKELQVRHVSLLQQRSSLLAEDRIKAAARKMGLYPPKSKQIKDL